MKLLIFLSSIAVFKGIFYYYFFSLARSLHLGMFTSVFNLLFIVLVLFYPVS